jgi:hypothetical protein
MEKVFRIKDLDTGQEYMVDEAAADSMMGGGAAGKSTLPDADAKIKARPARYCSPQP